MFGFALISVTPYGIRPGIGLVPGSGLPKGGAGANEGKQVRLKSLQASMFRKSATYFSSMMFCKVAGTDPNGGNTTGDEPRAP